MVYKNPLDLTKRQLIIVTFKLEGASWPGAYTPNIFGIYDASAIPDIGTAASARTPKQRIWAENQISGGGASFNRIQARFRNPSGTLYNWRALTNENWNASFQHSHSQANEGGYLTWTFLYDPTINGWAVCGFGYDTENASNVDVGFRMAFSSTYAVHGGSTDDIDEFDNDAYPVFGDLANDNGTYDNVLTIARFSIHECVGHHHEYSLSAGGEHPSFPYPYEIQRFTTAKGLLETGHPLWVPDGGHTLENVVDAVGSDDWKQDPVIWKHTDGNWYRVGNRRDSSGNGHQYISKSTDQGDSWGTNVDVFSYNSTGLDAGTDTVRFGQLFHNGTKFYWLFNSEESSPTAMKLYLSSCTGDPMTPGNWSEPTKKLSPTGVADDPDEDGCAQGFLFQLPNGDIRIQYAGYDETPFSGTGAWTPCMASADSIEGTWTRQGAIFELGDSQLTQFDGANNTTNIYTVDSTSKLSAGQPFTHGPQDAQGRTKYKPNRVKAVIDSTTFEAWHRCAVADNDYMSDFGAFSIAPRSIRVAPEGGHWEMWATCFRFDDSVEVVGRYVSAGLGDPFTETWSVDTGYGFPWLGMIRHRDNFRSQENIGLVFDYDDIFLAEPLSPGAYLQRMEHMPAPNPLLRM